MINAPNYIGMNNAAAGLPLQTNTQTPDPNAGRDRITQALMNIQNPPPPTYQPQTAGQQSLGPTPIGSSGTPAPTTPMPGASIPGMPTGMNPITNPTAMGMTGTGMMPQPGGMPTGAGSQFNKSFLAGAFGNINPTAQTMQQPPYPQPPGVPM